MGGWTLRGPLIVRVKQEGFLVSLLAKFQLSIASTPLVFERVIMLSPLLPIAIVQLCVKLNDFMSLLEKFSKTS